MYKEIYTDRHNIEISLMQILMAGVIILATLVLPASYIVYQERETARNRPAPYTTAALQTQTTTSNSSGRVAGAATDQKTGVVIKVPLTNYEIRFQSESQILTAAGAAAIVIALGLGAYLLFTPRSLVAQSHDSNR